tara:strand:+ start:66 stop:272 length:207 start_codon:yes stop_codon:yes gene_type:complete
MFLFERKGRDSNEGVVGGGTPPIFGGELFENPKVLEGGAKRRCENALPQNQLKNRQSIMSVFSLVFIW